MSPRDDDLLADVRKGSRSHPGTLQVPPGDERASLEVGDRALLSVEDAERLWFEVVRVRRDRGQVAYHGKLRSVPLVVRLKMTDVVRFEPRNVLGLERAVRRGAVGELSDVDVRDP